VVHLAKSGKNNPMTLVELGSICGDLSTRREIPKRISV